MSKPAGRIAPRERDQRPSRPPLSRAETPTYTPVSGQGLAQAAAVVRREYDPDVNVNNQAAALVYIQTNCARILGDYRATIDASRGANVIAQRGAILLAMKNTGLDGHANKGHIAKLLDNTAYAVPANCPEVYSAVVRALNHMEQETATLAVTSGDTESMKVGTEFSFSDGKPATDETASVHLDLVDRAKRDDKQKKVHAKAEKNIADWVVAAQAARAKIPGNPTIGIGPADKPKAEYARKVTYTFTEGNTQWTWWWVADIDQACYETQTMPTTLKDMRKAAIKAIIDEHIFGIAATLDARLKVSLKPDPAATGGGGHISLDLTSGFSRTDAAGTVVSYEVLIETLSALQRSCTILQRQFNAPESKEHPTGESDIQNAPWLKDQELRKEKGGKEDDVENALDAYAGVLKRLDTDAKSGNIASVADIQEELDSFNKRLTNPSVPEGKRKAALEDPEAISHYQAVNIEHIGDAEAGKRRMEIRDVPAQTSHTKLISDLEALQTVLQEARDAIKAEQEIRLMQV